MQDWQKSIAEIVQSLRQRDRRAVILKINQLIQSEIIQDNLDNWASLTKIAIAVGDYELAGRTAKKIADSQNAKKENLIYAAGALAEIRQFEQARTALNRIAEDQRNDPTIHHLFGTMLMQSSQIESAESQFRKTLDSLPLSGITWFSLVNLMKHSKDDGRDLKQLQTLFPNIGTEDISSQAAFLYAIGKIHHDRGEYQHAFSAYQMGAKRMKSLSKYNLSADTHQVEAAIWLSKQHIPFPQSETLKYGKTPIFVMGNPRSGSTLCEQILSAHSDVSSGGELNILHQLLTLEPREVLKMNEARFNEFVKEVRSEYFRQVEYLTAPSSHFVDKTLGNTRLLPWLISLFPEAKFIWMKRDHRDTALSAFRNFFGRSLDWTYSINEIHNHFKLEDTLYKAMSQAYERQIYALSYERLVQSPLKEIQALIEFCDLKPQADLDKFYKNKHSIATASVVQARSPISQKSIGGWQNYGPHFAQIT